MYKPTIGRRTVLLIPIILVLVLWYFLTFWANPNRRLAEILGLLAIGASVLGLSSNPTPPKEPHAELAVVQTLMPSAHDRPISEGEQIQLGEISNFGSGVENHIRANSVFVIRDREVETSRRVSIIQPIIKKENIMEFGAGAYLGVIENKERGDQWAVTSSYKCTIDNEALISQFNDNILNHCEVLYKPKTLWMVFVLELACCLSIPI